MKVFISWSGNQSRVVGELLRDWIKCVLQATQPWMSARDIDRGAVWFSEISEQLKDTGVGIVCLTHENKNRPWILFEAGALAKGLTTNRVCTLLIDLQHADVEEPLAQLNHTLPIKESMLTLVHTLNRQLGNEALKDDILETVFEMFWPQFDQKFQAALQSNPPTTTHVARSDSSMLAEILDNTRSLTGRLVNVEAHLRNEANAGMAGFYRPDLFSQEANKKLTQLVVEWVNDSDLTAMR